MGLLFYSTHSRSQELNECLSAIGESRSRNCRAWTGDGSWLFMSGLQLGDTHKGFTPMKTKGSWHPQAPRAQEPGGQHPQPTAQPLMPAPGCLPPLRLHTAARTTCKWLSFLLVNVCENEEGRKLNTHLPYATVAPRPLGKEYKVSVQTRNCQNFNFQHHLTSFTKQTVPT